MSVEFPISGDPVQGPATRDQANLTRHADSSRAPGVRFGNYELLGEIAHGGMGVVYWPRQLNPNRIVALKMVLPGHLSSEGAMSRFRIEAEAAASLDHPNIVPIYDVGEVAGQPYFSMRLIEGGSFATQITSFGADLDAAAKLIATVGNAVHYAHQRRVLHRDLKPSNILLDAQGEPYLTDFGLAKMAAHRNDLTLSGTALGTPEYMAPEQARGKTRELTTKSDVFSLGVILYQLLTGRVPFHGETALDTARQITEIEPPRPAGLNAKVDRDLETICLKCLEKDPNRRYDSAEQLADDLEHWRRRETILARPASTPTRITKWVRRRPAVAGLAASTALAAFLAVIGILWEWRLAEAARYEAEVRLAEALLREGQALAANNRPAAAKDRMEKSRSLALKMKTATISAELSLADIYRFSPPPLMTLTGHVGAATCIALSPDQRTLFSGGSDGTILPMVAGNGYGDSV